MTVSGNDFYFNLSGLSPNTPYQFRAWARNSAGWGTSGAAYFTTAVSCTYSLSPTSASPGSGSGSGSYSVFVGSGCGWSASSDATSWLHTGSSGSGNGTVNYTYDANASTTSRTGHITAGGQTFTVTQAGTTQRLTGIKIGVDPGHGGTSTGAVGPTGLTEKSVNLATALALKQYLEAEGATVFITRTTDTDVSLTSRSSLFINNAVNLAISVHHNGGGSSLDTTMVFIYCDRSLATRGAFASDVVQRLGTSTGISISSYPASTSDTLCAGHFDWLTGLSGVGQANLHMVREPELGGNILSILAEVSFITNPTEEAKLRDSDYLDKNGWAIY
ncbi:MAG: N-acetylmuramoyl-L-alanine amidase, partial [Bacteroidota bacterium]